MKRILTVLVMIAASVFIAPPVFADGDTPESTPTETTAPVDPAPETPAADPAPATDPAPAAPIAETPAAPAPEAAKSDSSAPAKPKSTAKVSTDVVAAAATKFFVCKYVGTPGTNERLKAGKNPISVAASGLDVGSYFQDAHGRSYVLAEDTGQDAPDASDCPPGDVPPDTLVIPVKPTVVASDTCEIAGSVSLPANLVLDGKTVIEYSFVTGSANMLSGDYDVLATVVADGYTFADDATTQHFTGTLVAAEECVDPPVAKVFVCKYVGKPGIDEVLQNVISVSVNALLGNDPGPVNIGDIFSDAHGKSVVIAFDTGQDPPSPDDCAAGVVATDAVPDVVTVKNCDGGDVPTPTPVNGVNYEFTVGDGISGPWEITATPASEEFVINGQSVFSGDAGDPDNCDSVDPVDPVDPSGDPDPSDTTTDGALPDTGGPQRGLVPLGLMMVGAGALIVGRRRLA